MKKSDFTALIAKKGHELFRQMPWRTDTCPYYVLVSELMLQQTQVTRVIPKFNEFIDEFPDVHALARSDLASVIRAWQGLGYNRRAKYLHDAARMIVQDFFGEFPKTEADILKLPGVGKNTCGAIFAYAYNQPSLFIETNIRTVYIHHFFADDFAVDDKAIYMKLAETVDQKSPREFYWALMDYGTWLKANGIKNINKSRHYKKQSPLEGSIRQVRGQIVAALVKQPMTELELQHATTNDERFAVALAGLCTDELVTRTDNNFHLTK